MPDSPSRPTTISNNRIPSGLIWTFGLLFLGALLALPFCIHRVMTATQSQERGMALVSLAGLPLDARTARAAFRESPDKSACAARYALGPADAAKVREGMPVVAAPDAEKLAALEKNSPKEIAWQPVPGSRGPWRATSGVKGDTAWFALLDEGAGVLWVCGARSASRAE